jgi:NADH-quinone oxidoreductase subunit J
MFEPFELAFLLLVMGLAVLAVELKNLMHAIVCFCGMCVFLGGLYAILNAPYVALFQILIYVGAVVVLFVIAVMLVTPPE